MATNLVPLPSFDAPRTEAEKVRSKMTTLHNTVLNGETEKKRASALKHLRKLAWAHQEAAAELGIQTEVPNMSRVMRFGTLSEPVVIDPQWTDAIERQMTLRHDLYNYLVTGSRALYRQAIDLLENGENFRAARELNNEIGKLYEEIREINRLSRRKVDSPEVVVLKERIAELKKQQEAPDSGLSKEIKAFYESAEYKYVTGEGLAALTKAGYQKYAAEGLYHTNYNPTIVEFSTAFKSTFKKVKTILSGLSPRYADRDGNAPVSVRHWDAWDHVGKTGVTVTNPTVKRKGGKVQNPDKPISGVYAGTNGFFRLRPLTEADLSTFPRLRKIDLSKPNAKRLYVAELRVVGPQETGGDPVFARIVVVLHRELPQDGTLASAVIESRREGFRLKHYLLVTVNSPAQAPKDKGAIATITITPEGDSIGSVSRTQDAEFSAWAESRGFDWLSSDGKLIASERVKVATSWSEELHYNVNEHLKQAMDRLDVLFPEGAEAKVRMPDWFYSGDFNLGGRRSLRRLYRSWRSHVLGAENANVEQLREVFRELRTLGRENVKNDWSMTVKLVSYKAEALLGLPLAQAEVFAIVSIATERYEHLYPWAARVREKALTRRKDEYRQFAAHFLKGVREVSIPETKDRKRFMSEAERNFASSMLLEAIKSVAEREGVKVVEV